jgi:DNA-binding response OmpR family regulator
MQPVKRRIFCVEDNADISEMLIALLGCNGYEATTAATAADALRLAGEGFDLFILDKIEARSIGLELCRELRRRNPDTPILIYSADAFEWHHREAFEAGATEYVNKPYTDALIFAVNKLLS